ncbi:MAG: hypothetical protein AUK03_05670 [Anaerolineae bacterium CG2_30_64_16]|nr:MAG: hypothetical protein AUK03_05670 [Anaerolineae bacterium CG2_30_64_16]
MNDPRSMALVRMASSSWIAIDLFMYTDHAMDTDPLTGLGVFLEVERPAVLLADATRPDSWISLDALDREAGMRHVPAKQLKRLARLRFDLWR